MVISKENKKFLKRMLYLVPPIVIQEILAAAVNMLDTVMIGSKMGIHEVTGVGLANQVFFLFTLVLFGIGSGSTVFNGQFWGKGEIKNIHKVMGIGFTCNLLAGILFFTLSFLFPEKIVSIYSKDPKVIELGAQYLRYVSISFPIFAITNTRNAAIRSTGQTRVPMCVTISAIITNFVLNYIFIFKLEVGLALIGLGTVITRTVEISVQEILIRKLRLPILAKIKDYFSFNKEFVKNFFKVAGVIVLNEVIWAFGVSSYNIAYSYAGTNSQGAVQITSVVMQIFQVFGNSIAIATSILITNTLGANKLDLAIRYSRKCIYLGMILSVIMGTLLITLAPFILSFYKVDDIVKIYARNIMNVVACGMLLKTTNFVTLVGILRSGGDAKFCFIVEIFAVWLIGMPIAFITVKYLELPIYWAILFIYCDELFKFFAGLIRVHSNKWANNIV